MSRCGSASALSVFVVYGVLPPLHAFWRRWDLLAHGGGAVENNAESGEQSSDSAFTYIVASSSGKTSGFDPLMDGSTPSATAIVL